MFCRPLLFEMISMWCSAGSTIRQLRSLRDRRSSATWLLSAHRLVLLVVRLNHHRIGDYRWTIYWLYARLLGCPIQYRSFVYLMTALSRKALSAMILAILTPVCTRQDRPLHSQHLTAMSRACRCRVHLHLSNRHLLTAKSRSALDVSMASKQRRLLQR